jgi:uncharacterized membrane protein
MVGGYMSFGGLEGKGRYHGTAVERCLPVKICGYDDRVETPEGATPLVTSPQHPVLKGVAGSWPYFLGYNRFEAKPDSSVLLEVNGDPFLVVHERGEGRAAAFASDCSPHWGSPEFMAWDGYAPFWGRLCSWLSGDHTSE